MAEEISTPSLVGIGVRVFKLCGQVGNIPCAVDLTLPPFSPRKMPVTMTYLPAIEGQGLMPFLPTPAQSFLWHFHLRNDHYHPLFVQCKDLSFWLDSFLSLPFHKQPREDPNKSHTPPLVSTLTATLCVKAPFSLPFSITASKLISLLSLFQSFLHNSRMILPTWIWSHLSAV